MQFQGITNLYVNVLNFDRITGKIIVIKHLVKSKLIIIFENSSHLALFFFFFFSEGCWLDSTFKITVGMVMVVVALGDAQRENESKGSLNWYFPRLCPPSPCPAGSF